MNPQNPKVSFVPLKVPDGINSNIGVETENGGQLSREFLKNIVCRRFWVNGILVLDAKEERRSVSTARTSL